jgi:hypothetical protein
MDGPSIAPHPGGGALALTPKQAKGYFEFFSVGTHREVLLLGDLVEQPVHYVRSKGHKVLCASRAGVCELCEKSADTDDVSTQQVEYYAAAYVRPWREREFHQRVAVFSSAAGDEVLKLIPDGTQRGHRLDVERYSHGNSGRFRIKLLAGLPGGFPAVLPPAFDLVPWVRARFGKRQDPARPLVFLPSFKVEAVSSGPAGRPRGLGLSAEDCSPTEDVMKKLREFKQTLGAQPTGQGAAAAAVPTEPPANGHGPTIREVVIPGQPDATPPDVRGLGDVGGSIDALLKARGQARPASICPSPQKAIEALERRKAHRQTPVPTEDLTAQEAVESGRIVEFVMGAEPVPATVPFSRNGHARKGGVS